MTTLPEAWHAAQTSRPSGRKTRLTGFLYSTDSSSQSQAAPFDSAMPYCASTVVPAAALRAIAVRLPRATLAGSGVVGWAIFAFAAAKRNGLPWAFAWQALHVCSET